MRILYSTCVMILTVYFCNSYKLRSKINPKGPTITHHAVSCILSLVDQYFEVGGLIVLTKSFNMTAPGADIERIFMEEVQELWKWSFMVVGKDSNDEQGLIHEDAVPNNTASSPDSTYAFAAKANYYVIIVDGKTAFRKKIAELIHLASWNPRALVVVLCSKKNKTQSTIDSYARFMLEHLWYYYVLHAVILLQDSHISTVFQVFSWNPYDPPRRCGLTTENTNGSTKIYDICQGGHLRNDRPLFEDKLPTNLKGCPLKVLAVIMPPFVNSLDDDTIGMEKGLLDTITRKLNFVVKFDFNSSSRGERLPDGGWTGIMDRLERKEGEVAIGAIYPDNEIHEDFDASVSYLQDSYTWIVPRALSIPRWQSLVIIFDKNMWLYVICTYFICAFVWYALGNLSNETPYHKSIVHCAINTFCMYIGGVAYNRPVHNTLRTFFIYLCIYNVILITAYTTKLITVLTETSYEHQINTLQELLEVKLNLGGLEEMNDLLTASDEPDYQEAGGKYIDIEDMDEALRYVVVDRNFSMLASRMYLKDVSSKKSEFSDDAGVPLYHIFSENVLSIPLEIITARGFPFLETFNEQISLIKANGLMGKWIKDFDINSQRKTANARRLARAHQQFVDDNDDVRLSLEHLEGGFMCLLVGYSMGTMALLAELFSKTAVFYSIRNKIFTSFHSLKDLVIKT